MIKILFVCHGNICRSPMAEFVMKDLVARRGLSDCFEIASAATSSEEIWRGVGNPVYGPAREELAKHGIDCSGKRAVQLTKQDYAYYDYLLCADSSNVRNALRITGPDTEGKIRLLLDYTDWPGASIADPWYYGNFDATYRDVREGCEGFFNWLINNGKV